MSASAFKQFLDLVLINQRALNPYSNKQIDANGRAYYVFFHKVLEICLLRNTNIDPEFCFQVVFKKKLFVPDSIQYFLTFHHASYNPN